MLPCLLVVACLLAAAHAGAVASAFSQYPTSGVAPPARGFMVGDIEDDGFYSFYGGGTSSSANMITAPNAFCMAHPSLIFHARFAIVCRLCLRRSGKHGLGRTVQ